MQALSTHPWAYPALEVVHLVGMGRAHGALVELHQHAHQLRRVRDDLAADAVAQVGPGRGGVEVGLHEDNSGTAIRQKCSNRQ